MSSHAGSTGSNKLVTAISAQAILSLPSSRPCVLQQHADAALHSVHLMLSIHLFRAIGSSISGTYAAWLCLHKRRSNCQYWLIRDMCCPFKSSGYRCTDWPCLPFASAEHSVAQHTALQSRCTANFVTSPGRLYFHLTHAPDSQLLPCTNQGCIDPYHQARCLCTFSRTEFVNSYVFVFCLHLLWPPWCWCIVHLLSLQCLFKVKSQGATATVTVACSIQSKARAKAMLVHRSARLALLIDFLVPLLHRYNNIRFTTAVAWSHPTMMISHGVRHRWHQCTSACIQMTWQEALLLQVHTQCRTASRGHVSQVG